jgi:uncharacterized damage-inducible protein DinB
MPVKRTMARKTKTKKTQVKKSKFTKPSSEGPRIAELLRRAFDGDAWHGPSLLEVLKDVDAATAVARPLNDVHSIWELVLHIAVWDRVAGIRLTGKISQPTGLANFPLAPSTPTEAAWQAAIEETRRDHNALVKTVAALSDERLLDRVPGKKYDFYHMLHGSAQHELYHAGQIAILKKGMAQCGVGSPHVSSRKITTF